MYLSTDEYNLLNVASDRVYESGRNSHMIFRRGMHDMKVNWDKEGRVYLPGPGKISSYLQSGLEMMASDLDDIAGELSDRGDTGTIQLAAAVRKVYEDREIVTTPSEREWANPGHADWSHNA